MIHNGHVPAFEEVRPRLLDRLSADRRQTIDGSTDSEHVFALLLQLCEEAPEAALHEVTREAIHHLQSWCDDVSAEVHTGVSDVPFDDLDTVDDEIINRTLALNLLWTDGILIGGARFNRSLWTLRRTGFYECPICGGDHTDAPESERYRATALASEPITDENWAEVPNGSVFQVADDGLLSPFSLSV